MARRKILIGYNGAPQGEDALNLGLVLSQALDALPALAVVVHYPHGDGAKSEAVTEFSENLFAEARNRAGDQELMEHVVVDESPARALNAVAEELQPEVTVIGSAHHGPAGRILLGGVGETMLSGAPCAIAVAPLGYRERDQGIRRIGVAVDGSVQSLRALQSGVGLAERTGASIRLLTVNTPHHYVLGGALSPLSREEYDSYKEGEAEKVQDVALEQVPDGVPADRVLLKGHPTEALAEAAQDLDLLMLGSRGYGPVKGVVLGSISTKLIASSPCPVLVMPRGTGLDPLGS